MSAARVVLAERAKSKRVKEEMGDVWNFSCLFSSNTAQALLVSTL